MDWQPSEADKAWQASFFSMLSDGTLWVTSCGVFKLDKANHRLTILDGPAPPQPGGLERIVKTCQAIGYAVST